MKQAYQGQLLLQDQPNQETQIVLLLTYTTVNFCQLQLSSQGLALWHSS